MRIFEKEGSGRVWKLLSSYRDLEVDDVVSIYYGPGKTKRDLYKVKEIENSVITLTTAYNVDVEFDIEVYGSSFLHILNPDIREGWINNFNKKMGLFF